jgi:predicted kinase
MAAVLFILGHACSGKTYLAKEFIKNKLKNKEFWCLMDKDTVGNALSKPLFKLLNLDSNDRDSPQYKTHIRDVEYEACLDVMREQLELGINVVSPGPWTKEVNDGRIFSPEYLNMPSNTKFFHIYLDVPEAIIRDRLMDRNHPRDKWKLSNWDIFKETLVKPENIDKNRVVIFTGNNVTEQIITIDKLLSFSA